MVGDTSSVVNDVVDRWSLTAVLAGLPIALIIFGPAVIIPVGDKNLLVLASQLAVAMLLVHIGFSALASHGVATLPSLARWLAASTALLALPVLWSADIEGGFVAYANFASGTIGGIAIALVWRTFQRSYSWIDVAYYIFLIGGVIQLTSAFSQAETSSALHQSAQTPWGNSNFVAACLVVAALGVMGRAVSLGKHRKYAVPVGVLSIGVALFTLSRGAILAACVGAVFFLWQGVSRLRGTVARHGHNREPGTHRPPLKIMLARSIALLIPFIAFWAIERVTQIRAEVNNRVYVNTDTRFALYELAWKEFVENPLTGTGWVSLRLTTQSSIGQSSTFAHNLLFSFLQIGGVLALPYLIVLAYIAYRSLRRGGPYAAAVGAALAISLTDPFFESVVGNLVVLPIALMASMAGPPGNMSEAAAGPSGVVLTGSRLAH